MLGALAERLLLRRMPGEQLAQVLVTLGLSFMAADFCLMVWGGDPISVATPPELDGFARFGVLVFPDLSAGNHRHRDHRSRSRFGCCSIAPDSAP